MFIRTLAIILRERRKLEGLTKATALIRPYLYRVIDRGNVCTEERAEEIFYTVKQLAMAHHQFLHRKNYGSDLVPPTPGVLHRAIEMRYFLAIFQGRNHFYPPLSWFTSSCTTIDQLIEFRVQWMGGWRCLSSACLLLLCAALMMWRDQQRAQCKLTINCT